MRLTALVVAALAVPGAVSAGGGALGELRRAAGPGTAVAAPEAHGGGAGVLRFCAFSGGEAGVQGTLESAGLRLDAVGADKDAGPVPVVDQGLVRPEAGVKARALLGEMLSQSPAEVSSSLRAHRVLLIIVPQDKKLTDLPQFAALRGVRLPDGRVWDEVRGVGFVSEEDGTVAVAAGEENFLGDAAPDRYPKGFLLAHEFSHAVHGYGLSAEEKARIAGAYADRWAGQLEFPSRYASTNELEYFAVSASSFFGRTLSGRDPERPIGWIEQHDAAIFAVLRRAYGAPRPLWSDALSDRAAGRGNW